MVHLVDVVGSKMWYIHGMYFWTKKEAENHIRVNYKGDDKRMLLKQLKEHQGRARCYMS